MQQTSLAFAAHSSGNLCGGCTGRPALPSLGVHVRRASAVSLCFDAILSILFQASCARWKTMSESDQLPPLIPRKVLFGNPSRTGLTVSPDGEYLAWLQPDELLVGRFRVPCSRPRRRFPRRQPRPGRRALGGVLQQRRRPPPVLPLRARPEADRTALQRPAGAGGAYEYTGSG